MKCVISVRQVSGISLEIYQRQQLELPEARS
jgi:hypothetical protein